MMLTCVSYLNEHTFLDGYCSTVQGLLDWFEIDLGFTELLFIQIDLCVLCVVPERAQEANSSTDDEIWRVKKGSIHT